MQRIVHAPQTDLRHSVIGAPWRLWLAAALLLASWWTAWFGPAPFSEYTFFPLWLGYILTVDGLTARRSGTSLLARDPRRFALLFAFSIPLWWLFEFANSYLGNWSYLMPRPYGRVEYWLIASLDFSTVMPAIFVTAELLRTFPPFASPRRWIRLAPGPPALLRCAAAGLVIFVASLLFPRYLYPLVWIGLFLLLDPINALLGYPSITAQVRQGRWDTVLVLFGAGLVCGWFWEMWNFHSMPKWVYEVPYVDWFKVFEMPLLGYGGYLPFALEVFAFWSLLHGVLLGSDRGWLRFAQPYSNSCGQHSERGC